jgi:hypothetical protein
MGPPIPTESGSPSEGCRTIRRPASLSCHAEKPCPEPNTRGDDFAILPVLLVARRRPLLAAMTSFAGRRGLIRITTAKPSLPELVGHPDASRLDRDIIPHRIGRSREDGSGRRTAEIIIEVFGSDDPIIAPRCPIHASADDVARCSLAERGGTAKWAAAGKDISRPVGRAAPGATTGGKKPQTGRPNIADATTHRRKRVEGAGPPLRSLGRRVVAN